MVDLPGFCAFHIAAINFIAHNMRGKVMLSMAFFEFCSSVGFHRNRCGLKHEIDRSCGTPIVKTTGVLFSGNQISAYKTFNMAKTEVVAVIGIPNPEVPILNWLVNVAVGLRIKKLALIKSHGETLGLATLVGG